MGKPANFVPLAESPTYYVIRDIGPWDIHFTITNDVEHVVESLLPRLQGRRLFYMDSDGDLDEILIENDKFKDFAPAPKEIYHMIFGGIAY